MSNPDLVELLQARGHRVTRARTAVWETLVTAGGHLTAEELAERLDADINLASIYRSLTLFEELDLVRQSRLGGGQAGRWELTHPDEDFHVVCRICGAVDHHGGTLVQSIREHLGEGHGFLAEEVSLTVTGVCSGCADDVANGSQ